DTATIERDSFYCERDSRGVMRDCLGLFIDAATIKRVSFYSERDPLSEASRFSVFIRSMAC
ncbi:hypothetical protein, partial [Saccharicrinis aurantiacus]|uniref:hypothetical protein n=1 Tax=Saccharicrinis aurantiacus TaxID=1849719 RepID=UPI001C9E4C9E